MKFTLELNRDTERPFEKVLGTHDPDAIADDIHKILLAEFEWNGEYSKGWHRLKDPQLFVYPKSGERQDELETPCRVMESFVTREGSMN